MIELITVSRGIPVNDCTSVIIGVVQLVEPVIIRINLIGLIITAHKRINNKIWGI